MPAFFSTAHVWCALSIECYSLEKGINAARSTPYLLCVASQLAIQRLLINVTGWSKSVRQTGAVTFQGFNWSAAVTNLWGQAVCVKVLWCLCSTWALPKVEASTVWDGQKSSIEWASSLVLGWKKNGDLRVCLDYHWLNLWRPEVFNTALLLRWSLGFCTKWGGHSEVPGDIVQQAGGTSVKAYAQEVSSPLPKCQVFGPFHWWEWVLHWPWKGTGNCSYVWGSIDGRWRCYTIPEEAKFFLGDGDVLPNWCTT